MRLIDLFSGCGGLTLGFSSSGLFEPVFAVEWDADAGETYRLNFGDHVAVADIADVTQFPTADIIVGGPPCQGFSTLNMRGVGLERCDLWREYVRVLAAVRPAMFVMENVPRLLSSSEYKLFREHLDPAYEVADGVLNAADFGVPQHRKRAIVFGSRIGAVALPEPTHGNLGAPWSTVRESFQGLPIRPDERNWHRSRNPTAVSIERYRTIPKEGENRFDLADRRPDITPRCWLEKPMGSTDVFGRLWWDKPAVTIRTEFFKPEKGRCLHPSAHRPITVREAARLMTFPDGFVFPEEQSMTSVARQIGNAVPPMLAAALAEQCAEALATNTQACAA